MSHSSNGTTSDRDGPTELTESDRHRLLASERRRMVLEVLADRTMPIELEALAAAIAAQEDEPDTSMERLVVSLHHDHLPKLSDYGVIDYDPGSTRVESYHAQLESLTV